MRFAAGQVGVLMLLLLSLYSMWLGLNGRTGKERSGCHTHTLSLSLYVCMYVCMCVCVLVDLHYCGVSVGNGYSCCVVGWLVAWFVALVGMEWEWEWEWVLSWFLGVSLLVDDVTLGNISTYLSSSSSS